MNPKHSDRVDMGLVRVIRKTVTLVTSQAFPFARRRESY